jgi:general secretion pathway protein L
MPRKIVSLDIGKTDLRAAIVETGFRDFKIEGLYREALPSDPAAVAKSIERFIGEHATDADTVLSALPAEAVSWRTLHLPFRDNRKLAQTVPYELESNVPFGLDEVVVDFQILSRDASGATVLAALAPKREVERHLDLLRAAGVDPKILDAGPLTALNTLTLVADRPSTFAFVDGSDQAVTVALYRNASLVGVRSLMATEAFGPATGGNGSGPSVEAATILAATVRWTLLAFNGAPLDERMPCYVAGTPEWVDAVARGLETAMDVEIRRLDRLSLSSSSAAIREKVPGFGSSLGLALREVTPSETFGFNFRRGEFTFHRSEQELRAGLRTAAILALVVVALTVGEMYAKYKESQVRLAAIEQQIQEVFEATVPNAGPGGRPLDILEEEIAFLRQDVEMLDDVVPVANSTSVDLLRAVSAAVPNDLRVDSEEYVMDTDSVRLTANADTFESVDSLRQKFMETGFFSDVQVKDARAAAQGAGVDFRLVMVLNKNFRPPSTR